MKCWKLFASVAALGFTLCAASVQLVNLPSMPESKLVHKVSPAYPPDAANARVQGTVTLRVTISNNGHVIAVRPISGPPLLKTVAIQAVRRWVYEPTVVDGRAVRVVTEVNIPFALDRDGHPVTPSATELHETSAK
jgi:TonB family protein